jgi:putative transposase
LSSECLWADLDFGLRSNNVVDVLEYLHMTSGLPEAISVDNGSELTSRQMDQWSYINGIKLFFSSRKTDRNGQIEAFNRRLRDEWVSVYLVQSLDHAKEEVEK